ncbi:hypothetical protein M758_8G058300 [Ceratodon purpureus]|nr:hypothetical protein M758_8G058300 [Ceratodon purpureus]
MDAPTFYLPLWLGNHSRALRNVMRKIISEDHVNTLGPTLGSLVLVKQWQNQETVFFLNIFIFVYLFVSFFSLFCSSLVLFLLLVILTLDQGHLSTNVMWIPSIHSHFLNKKSLLTPLIKGLLHDDMIKHSQ